MQGSRYKKLFAVFKDRFGKDFNVFGNVPDILDDFTLLFLVCAAIICDAYFFGAFHCTDLFILSYLFFYALIL